VLNGCDLDISVDMITMPFFENEFG